jgi:hypothetical protein
MGMARSVAVLACGMMIVAGIGLAGEPPRPADAALGRQVVVRLMLNASAHGIEGAVELVGDARIDARTRRPLQDWYMFGFNDPPAVAPPVDVEALAEAELRLVASGGRTLATFPLQTPFAALQSVALGGDRPTDFVLETTQGGFGQFTGSLARPFTVEAGGIRFLKAEGDRGEVEDVVLVRGPRTDWRIIPAVRGGGSEIFQVVCRPGEGGDDAFGEDYVAYRRSGTQWRRQQRQGRGYCSWPDGFPPLSSFP